MKRRFKVALCAALVAVLTAIGSFSGIAVPETDTEQPMSAKPAAAGSYLDYQNSLKEKNKRPGESAAEARMKEAVFSGGHARFETDGNGEYAVLDEETAWAEFPVTVETAGVYRLEFTYKTPPGSTDSPRRALELGSDVNIAELSNIVFQRYWTDGEKKGKNSLGDEVRPRLVEQNVVQTMLAEEFQGRFEEPFSFDLTAGERRIKLSFIQGALHLYSIRLVPEAALKSYSDVLAEWREAGYKSASDTIKINAEDCFYKTDSSIRLEFSADPCADPPSSGGTVYNAIGGQNWNLGNLGITWAFDVTESGLYALDFRVFQKFNDGLSSFRQILIDGQVPYAEFSAFEFEDAGWRTVRAGGEKDPYLVYLAAGPHTLTMRVKTSAYTEILYEMEKNLDLYYETVQSIILITSISPDANFDYQLFKKLPGLLDALSAIRDSLNRQIKQLTDAAATAPGPVNSLKEIGYRIDKMIKNPYSIPSNLSYLIDGQTTLSSWISGFNNLPLTVDYILVTSPDKALVSEKAGVFSKLWFSTKVFLQSFTRDYNAVGGAGSGAKKTIDVWLVRGAEWAQVLKNICDDDFSKQHGINVRMKILPASASTGPLGTNGVLLMSAASATNPDAIIGTDSTMPAEYGMRDALADLSKMEGYDEVVSRFPESTLTPLSFGGAVYGLPEVLDFTVMYYRTDIFESLSLKPPATWEELYSLVLPELKRKGMDFWYEGGLNTFLFQQGGSFYSEDGRKSALNTPEAIEAFRQFSELYLVYNVPVAANFYTRFRAGRMPIGISSFNTYLALASAAQELNGKWAVMPIPGTKKPDGTIDRSNSVGTTSCMIFESSDNQKEAWEFLKYYTDAQTQTRYAGDLVAYIGPEAKWCSANTEAFDRISWDNNLKQVIAEQRPWCRSMPNVAGGYITARQIENARVRTVIQHVNYRESLERAAEEIDQELALKSAELEKRRKNAR